MTTPVQPLRDALAGRYEIEEELGRGGMATVYRARDLRHERVVALKVLEADASALVGAERFVREIRTAAALSHPHILPMYDSGSAGGFLYYVMPVAEGESLRKRLERERQLSLADALRITAEVASALSYAHEHHVVHRDIKPENILLHGGHALVADFGVAGAIGGSGDDRITASGFIVGTVAYMSPEQASGERNLDGRADVYSLACVLYEMLSGEPPHTGVTPQAVRARQLQGEVRSLVTVRPSVSRRLDAAIRRGLAPAPADRFATAAEFAAEVESAAVAGEAQAAGRRSSFRRVLLGAGAVAAAVLLVLATQRLLHGPGPANLGGGVAVFPFRASGSDVGEWTENLADLLATALDGTPGVRVTDPWSLWQELRFARDQRANSPDPAEAARLARRAGAARYVLGSIVQTGRRAEVTVRLYRSAQADEPVTIAEGASIDSLPGLVQRIAVGLVAQLSVKGSPRVERYVTHSMDALKAYLSAREAMRRGLVDSADVAIDRALALDSNFAQALVTAVGIKSWRQYGLGRPYTGLLPLAERAVATSDSLGERERLRARAILASVRTEGGATAEAAGRILERDSTDVQALELLSYSHQVYGWQYGKGELEARQVSERLLRLDPGNVSALIRRAYLAVATEDSADIRNQITHLERTDTSNALIRSTLWSVRALELGPQRFTELAGVVAAAPLPEWIGVFRLLRTYAPERAEELLQRLRATVGPGVPQRTVFGASTQLAIAEGRLREVDSLARAGAFLANPGLEPQVNLLLVASAIAGVGDDAASRRALDALIKMVPVDSTKAYFNSRPVWWAGWSIAAWHAMFGDSTVTLRWRVALGTLPGGGTSKDYRGALQSDLDSRLAARRGDLQGALRLSQRAYDLWTIHANTTPEGQPDPAIRFHMATLLRATGRPDSAAAVLRSLVPPVTWMGFYTARASLELGEIAEARGDRVAASRYYAMAASLWERGGPEVASWRDRAASGLRRMPVEAARRRAAASAPRSGT